MSCHGVRLPAEFTRELPDDAIAVLPHGFWRFRAGDAVAAVSSAWAVHDGAGGTPTGRGSALARAVRASDAPEKCG